MFFSSSASHNGIYIGGGKIVHAPTEGQDVKVEYYQNVGDVHSIRRITGCPKASVASPVQPATRQ